MEVREKRIIFTFNFQECAGVNGMVLQILPPGEIGRSSPWAHLKQQVKHN